MGEYKDLCIREFGDDDADAVASLIHRTIDTCYTEAYPPRAVGFFKRFHSREGILERSRKGTILVVERDGEVVGTGALVDNEIYGVFVDPSLQGEGAGRAIMSELERRAVAAGRDHVCLSVSLPSRRFYEILGYEILHEAFIDVGEGQRLDYWEARKPL